MTIASVPQSTLAHPYSAWLDLVRDLVGSTQVFPRRLLARELARTFQAQVSLEWNDPDGAHGVEVFDPPAACATGTLEQLRIPYRLTESSRRTFVLARESAEFTLEELDLAVRLQALLALLDRGREETDPDDVAASLTERELSVVALLSQGYTAAAIARRLGISPRTVHVHLRNVYRKFGVNDRLLAARIFRDSRRIVTEPA